MCISEQYLEGTDNRIRSTMVMGGWLVYNIKMFAIR